MKLRGKRGKPCGYAYEKGTREEKRNMREEPADDDDNEEEEEDEEGGGGKSEKRWNSKDKNRASLRNIYPECIEHNQIRHL